ncbi:MAG: SCO family protein [Hyphomicrobium sp.]
MRSRFVIVALVGLMAGGLVALITSPDMRSTPKASVSTGKALIGGPFSLVDHDGKPVTERDFAGRPMLVMFGFTSCPDICPSGLQLMAAALEKLGDKGRTLTPLFISLDPERDTPAKLKDYVSSFHPAIRGLTGTVADVASAAKAYRVYYKKVPLDGGEGYTIDHSSFFYIMDGKGEFITHVPHSANPDALSLRLKSVL